MWLTWNPGGVASSDGEHNNHQVALFTIHSEEYLCIMYARMN